MLDDYKVVVDVLRVKTYDKVSKKEAVTNYIENMPTVVRILTIFICALEMAALVEESQMQRCGHACDYEKEGDIHVPRSQVFIFWMY